MEAAKLKIFGSVAGYTIYEDKTNAIEEELNLYSLNDIQLD
jgi:hypothetical protein